MNIATVEYSRYIVRPDVKIFFLAGICVCIFILFFAASYLIFPSEDAVILFEYSKNLAEKGIITYGNAAYPIEGATDFLWMALIAGFHKLGAGDYSAALALNGLSAVVIAAVFARDPGTLILAGLAIFVTPFLYASLLGFSALFFSAAYVLVLYFGRGSSKLFYPLVLTLCLTRPDGTVWAAGAILYRYLAQSSLFPPRKELTDFSLYFLIPGIAYFFWRAYYFSEWLPLPFLVKSQGGRDLFIFYFTSIKNVFQVLGPLLLAALIFSRDRKQDIRTFALLFFVPAIFYSAMRLDQNVGSRFLAPMFFGGMFVLSAHASRIAMAAAIFISAISMNGATRLALDEIRGSKAESVFYLSQDLRKLKGSMLVTEAGRLAYYTGWDIEDSWGLNTPRFAKELVSLETIAAKPYDLIVAHCGYFSGGGYRVADKAPLPRSWENHCKIVVSHIMRGGYTIYLVPFFARGGWIDQYLYIPALQRPDPLCSRYDLFAVNDKSPAAAPIAEILRKYGAMESPYDPSKYREGADGLCLVQ